MRQRIKGFRGILCIMAIITSLVMVMPVSAEEVQGTETRIVSGNDAIAGSEAVYETAVATTGAELNYTDEQGNIFAYELDESGNATITGITVSGAALTIPEMISEAPVVTVANGSSCVISNPTVIIPELTINSNTIGARAFSGLSIGNLVIGEDVRALSIYNDEEFRFKYYYEQFAGSKIDKVIFNAVELALEYATNDILDEFYGPFYEANVGALEIGSSVTLIPELLFQGAIMNLETLELQVERIGAYAFSGSGISIGTLILDRGLKSLEESYYSTEQFHYWEQFSHTTIGTIKLYTPELELTKRVGKITTISSSIYAPFYGASVGSLEIGSDVQMIPDYFLNEARMSMEELTIHTPIIGAFAFGSSKISFGTLSIGTEVTTFPESFYGRNLFHYWNQFQGCNIGHLIYGAEAADVVNDVDVIEGTNLYGPFDGATISAFTLMENVTYIPDYLLKDSAATIEELDLNMSAIGAMAFKGEKISIGKLTLGADVQVLKKSEASTNVYQYWEQFSKVTIGEVYYNVPSLELSGEAEIDNHNQGPFYLSKIGQLYLSDEVERIPAYCFIDCYLEQEELYIRAKNLGTRAFASDNISIGTLTIGTEVENFESVLNGSLTYYRQFAGCSVDTLVYLPVSLETGTVCYKGIFDQTVIGNLMLDEAVEAVPNFLLYNAVMELEDFTLNVPVIGYYSFASEDILFHKLTVGEHVTTFVANSSNYNRAFDESTIEQLDYYAPDAKMETLTQYAYGPFSFNTVIKGLTIGDNVVSIPYGCFRDADMNVEELTIENAAIGYGAFGGNDIIIGTLHIGNNVTYNGVISNQMNCFQWATIGTLNYNSNAVEPEWSTSTSSWGMFAFAAIHELNIGKDVETIPAFWFRNAKMSLEALTIPCAWSYYAFYSSDISIGTLTLNGDVAEINQVSNCNMAFHGNTINTVVYDIPSAVFTATNTNAYGPFFNTTITNFILGEHVEYIDYRLLRGNTITDCYVYSVRASESFPEQDFANSYLPTCTNLHIHYNSDFKPFFSQAVTAYHWLCVEYFDKTYGDKIYDEETGEYVVEIFKTCSVCGYEEQDVEELDNSYDIYLSIPVEIPLTFDTEAKSYVGSEQVYAYGTLGNAYEGLQLVVERDVENYGKAVMGEGVYHIASYLSVGFNGGEAAVFSSTQLSENAAQVAVGEVEALYKEQMRVTVDALAFVEGGAGNYQISIPLKLELK